MDVVRSGTTTTFICVTSFVVVLATAVYQWTMKPLRILQSIGIPIADGFKPFVGHVLEENKQKHVGEFYVECLRKYGKVYGMVEFRSSAVVVADQEMLKEILTREFNYFTDRRFIPLRGWMEKSMLEQKGAEWKRIRTMITPFFSSGKMKQHTNIMIQCSNTLLENLRIICSSNASNCFNARSVAEAYAMDVICGCGYGLNTDSQNNPDHPLISTMRRISNISMVNPKLFLAFTFPALGSLMSACGMSMFPSNYLKFFESTVRQLIDERKKNPAEREDFLDTLVKAEEDFIQQQKEQNADNTNNMTNKGLNKEEVLAQALLFFLAGYDTTAGALSFLMYNLAIHPHIQGKLYEEIRQHFGGNELPGYENVQKLHYLDCCINESLRLYPASFILDREAVEDVTVLGVHLPKGTGVIVPIWAIHRDPQIWPDPDSFKPDRFLADDKEGCMGQLEYSLLQFGAGQRACIGARFARLEVKIAITRILHFFELKPNDRTQIPLEMETGLFVHPKDGVWLSLSPRS